MPKLPLARGAKYFERRNGVEGFSWEGMATKVDPGGSPPNRPRFLVNTRIQGGSIVSRPNFSGVGTIVPALQDWNENVFDGTTELGWQLEGYVKWSPHWAAEHNTVAGVRLWWSGADGVFGFLDTDSEPIAQQVGVYPSQFSTASPVFERFNNELYLGEYGNLRKIYLLLPPAGQAPVDVLPSPADEVIATFAGFRVSSILTHAGKLFFVLSDPAGATNGFVYSWDGFQVLQELALGTPAALGTTLTEFMDTLVLTISGFASILVRDAAGAWTSHTVGGFACSPFMNSVAVYRAGVYIMSGDNRIFLWNGTALSLAHTIAVGGRTVNHAHCCATMQGRFYFIWTDTTPDPTQVVLGYLDLDNTALAQWNDVGLAPGSTTGFIAAPGLPGGLQDINVGVALAEYRARLWLVIGSAFAPAVPVEGIRLYTHSRQYMPWDAWYICGSGAPDLGPGSMTDLVGVSGFRRL